MSEMDPLGQVVRRALHIIFLVDTSGSMSSAGRIQALNQAVRTVLPELKDAADRNPQADISFRALEFNSHARWTQATSRKMGEFGVTWHWEDLGAGGLTSLGAALRLLTEELAPEKLGSYNYPPVLLLLSDGSPTDDWESALESFNQSPYGKRPSYTVRAALAVEGADRDVLARFTGNAEMVVDVTNPTQMVQAIRWGTIALSTAASRSQAIPDGPGGAPAPAVGVQVAPPVMDDDSGVF
jgi:uncharacterized protein YegL